MSRSRTPIPRNPIHSQACCCRSCRPAAYQDEPIVAWRWVVLLAAGGTAALLIDLAGYTPTIAAVLGMMP